VRETTLGHWFRVAIRRSAALRAVVRSGPVQRLIMTGRESRSVRESLRFAARQSASRSRSRYRLRESGLKVVIRHRTRDVDILREIFGGGAGGHCYEPPPPVAEVLHRSASPRVLDLGGHIGLFGAWVFGRWPTARTTSYEPDPGNARLLAATIASNALDERWEIVEAAVTTRAGQAPFAAGCYADSHLAGSPSERTITVATVDMFRLDHAVDLLKMDIEGGEWPILLEPRLSDLQARFVLLEWHGRSSPEPHAHAAVLRLLRGAGYEQIVDAGRDHEADVGVLWAWRREEDGSSGPRREELPQ
jgi:FkbM family methyltransferase